MDELDVAYLAATLDASKAPGWRHPAAPETETDANGLTEAERVRRETAEGIAAAIERRRLSRRRRWLRSGRWSARDEAVWSQAMRDAQRIAREQAR